MNTHIVLLTRRVHFSLKWCLVYYFISISFFIVIHVCKWATSWQNQQNGMCAKTQISLSIRQVWSVFAFRMKKAGVFSYPLSAQQRLLSDWADAQADLSLRWVHSHFVDTDTRRLKWLIRSDYTSILFVGYPSLQRAITVSKFDELNQNVTTCTYSSPKALARIIFRHFVDKL